MARIFGIAIPDNKKIGYSLPYIYGVGIPLAKKILKDLKIDENIRTKDITVDELKQIQDYIEKHFNVENELRRETRKNISRLINIGSYRGYRHSRHLPVRGQRTKTNTRTVRGNVRKSVGSGRAKAATPK
ncbi:MAG: 30S ribosomal protein S13 [Candidatus Paceibacterota bacterium]|jgi:small subunit ribosomal protein S13